jgi:hypothetical protein
VDATGKAQSAEILESPDKDLGKAMAEVLLLQKYKPAVCKGVPCEMTYPFRMYFGNRFDSH